MLQSAEKADDRERWVSKLEHAMMLSWRRSTSMFRASWYVELMLSSGIQSTAWPSSYM